MKREQKQKPTREERRRRGREARARARQDVRQHPLLFTLYVVLRALVLLVLVREAIKGDYYNVFLCALTLTLFLIPTFVERSLHIDVPNTLEVIILLFIFSAEILGEIQEYYLIFPLWDTMLHTMNGFLMAAIGIAMVDILNRSDKFKVRLSPAFVALVAFCFSMTTGVVWEFFEYAMDTFFAMDMQKDTWVHAFHTVSLNPEGKNAAVPVIIESVVVNGEAWPAYLDIGLHDTMKDLLVNFVGAVIFSVLGLLYLKNRGKGGKFINRFIPKLKVAELASSDPSSLLEPRPLEASPAGEPEKGCVFCAIAQGESPCYKIYEDETTLAFLDTAGDAEGHTLVVPKAHAESLLDCPMDIAAQVLDTVKRVADHYVGHCGYQGVNILSANGKSAGQSVPHLHFHLIPRRDGDGLKAWPALGKSRASLEEVCRRLALPSPRQDV